jgi:predicted acetyltransferase
MDGTLSATGTRHKRKVARRAIVLAALRGARERGYRIAVLTASDMGARIYQALGFQAYCQIAMYVWMSG